MANARNHEKWLKNYQRLVAYTQEHGHCSVPRSFVSSEGFKLGIWAADQRRRRHSHSLEETRALEELSGWVWNAEGWRKTRK